MTVRRSAATGVPPTVFVFGPTFTPASSAPDRETGETTAVPAARPSGVATVKTAAPERVLRPAVQLCGVAKSKGRSALRAGADAPRAHERAVAAPPGARVLAVAPALAHRRAAAPLGERLGDGQSPGHR